MSSMTNNQSGDKAFVLRITRTGVDVATVDMTGNSGVVYSHYRSDEISQESIDKWSVMMNNAAFTIVSPDGEAMCSFPARDCIVDVHPGKPSTTKGDLIIVKKEGVTHVLVNFDEETKGRVVHEYQGCVIQMNRKRLEIVYSGGTVMKQIFAADCVIKVE